jgi:hypothetical protein
MYWIHIFLGGGADPHIHSFSRQNKYEPEEPEDSFDESKIRDKNLHCCPRKVAEEFVL